jgi:hypothetical protein
MWAQDIPTGWLGGNADTGTHLIFANGREKPHALADDTAAVVPVAYDLR